MKGDCEEYFERDDIKKFRTRSNSQRKINTLLASLLEKEEELTVYKNRLKELEAAFYYNLELISERDLELSVLEKQLTAENEQFEEVIRERNELEDLIKAIDEKNNRKMQQLETKLTLKEEEIRDLQRENLNNIASLKRIINDVKQQQEKKLTKMNNKFEMQKSEMIRSHREQIEEKEKYYLLEVDDLTAKLEQACREKEKLACAEDEVRDLKRRLQDLEKLFVQKENHYLEKLRKFSNSHLRKVNKEVQCTFCPQLTEKTVQTESSVAIADSQPGERESSGEEKYKERISFLQEQNEVLKFIIKDLKRNRECVDQPPGCECLNVRAEVERVNQKFETEISNLKKILESEQTKKAEEDAVIRSLEASVTSLKEKLLWGLQGKLQQLSGDDIYWYLCDRETRVTLLEERLHQKINVLMTATELERQTIYEKLEEVKKDCIERIEKCLKSWEEPKSESLLEKIRGEIQKLEDKMESDARDILRSGGACAMKYYQNAGPPALNPGGHCKNEISAPQRGQLFQNRFSGKCTGEEIPPKFSYDLTVGRENEALGNFVCDCIDHDGRERFWRRKSTKKVLPKASKRQTARQMIKTQPQLSGPIS